MQVSSIEYRTQFRYRNVSNKLRYRPGSVGLLWWPVRRHDQIDRVRDQLVLHDPVGRGRGGQRRRRVDLQQGPGKTVDQSTNQSINERIH